MTTTVYTIGYERTDIERFVETLVLIGVSTVADVRAVPLSRKRGFSKHKLRAALWASGISYEHFVGLGDPKEGRDAARRGDYSRFRAVFSAHLRTAGARDAIDDLARCAGREPTCLLCFERDPEVCHRSIIAQELHGRGMTVLDLYGDDPSRYDRHARRLPRHHPGEGAAASE